MPAQAGIRQAATPPFIKTHFVRGQTPAFAGVTFSLKFHKRSQARKMLPRNRIKAHRGPFFARKVGEEGVFFNSSAHSSDGSGGADFWGDAIR